MRSLSYKLPSIHLAWLCDKGPVRAVNEDALLVQKRSIVLSEGYETGTSDVALSSNPLFLGVADGCGGGDHEDSIAEDILRYIANAVFSTELPRMGRGLPESIRDVNRYLNDESNRRADRRTRGATLAAALVDHRQATIAQVGDTRFYRYGDGMLVRSGRDQTLVEQLISAGQITAEEARRHAYSAVGLTPNVGISTSTFGLRNKDWLLLCTDGIWRLVRDELIEETIRDADSPWKWLRVSNRARSSTAALTISA